MKLFLSIVLGVLAALFAAVLVAALTSGPDGSSSISLSGGSMGVAVASREMMPGHMLEEGDVQTQEVPRQAAMARGMLGAESVVGRTLIRPIQAGQAIDSRSLAGAGSGPEIASMLRDGYRATSVTLTDRGPGTFVYPGSYVDVIAIFKMPDGMPEAGQTVSRTVLEGVRVLAVDGFASVASEEEANAKARQTRGSSRGPMITLLLTPTQSQVLQLAKNLGSVSVTLRSLEDDQRVPPTTVSLKQLLAYQPEKPQVVLAVEDKETEGAEEDESGKVADGAVEEPIEAFTKEQRRRWETLVIRNGKRSTYEFEESE